MGGGCSPVPKGGSSTHTPSETPQTARPTDPDPDSPSPASADGSAADEAPAKPRASVRHAAQAAARRHARGSPGRLRSSARRRPRDASWTGVARSARRDTLALVLEPRTQMVPRQLTVELGQMSNPLNGGLPDGQIRIVPVHRAPWCVSDSPGWPYFTVPRRPREATAGCVVEAADAGRQKRVECGRLTTLDFCERALARPCGRVGSFAGAKSWSLALPCCYALSRRVLRHRSAAPGAGRVRAVAGIATIAWT